MGQMRGGSYNTTTSDMGKINLLKRQKKLFKERKKESNIKNAMKAFQEGKFKSISGAAEAYGLHYSTLS